MGALDDSFGLEASWDLDAFPISMFSGFGVHGLCAGFDFRQEARRRYVISIK